MTAADRTPPTALFLVTLVVMTALAPFSMQIFLPAVPAIQADFAADSGTAQLTVSLAMAATAVATLAYGPLSDRYGRRPVMIVGLGIFLSGSVLCYVAPSVDTLIVGRIVQAAGATSGMVLARAIVRDVYAAHRVASMIAYLTVAMVVAPMVAPALGGLITDYLSWRDIFLVLSVAGLLVLGAVLRRLAETSTEPPTHPGLAGLFEGIGLLLASRRFLGFALQTSSVMAMFFTFASGMPYVMVEVLERPAAEYGFYFMLVAAGFMAGNFVTGRISHRVGVARMVLYGIVLSSGAVVVMAALVLSGVAHPLAFFAPAAVISVGHGFTMPNAQAGALEVRPRSAGTASGLLGFLQLGAAAIFAQVVGLLHDGSATPMIGLMAIAGATAFVGIVMTWHWE